MKPALKVFLLFVYLKFSALSVQAQEDTIKFSTYQNELADLYQNISTAKVEDKANSEQIFFEKYTEVLSLEGSKDFVFQKLKNIGRTISADENLIIHSWNFQDAFGYSNYYCIIQYYSKKNKTTKTFALKEDKTSFAQHPERPSNPDAWYGSLYYEIVETKLKGKVYYTLLGFNFNNALSNKKVIETVFISEFGDLEFASNIFMVKNKPQSRIVYEFAERARMTLKYDPILKMIVADHLSPQKPSLEGQFQFYGPDGSYDAFEFTDGIWIQKVNIEIKY